MTTAGDGVTGKPTAENLGIDVAALSWQRSGDSEGAIEIAFARGQHGIPGEWVLMRVAGDPEERILVYDRHEWECFLDGVRKGEFDDALD
jgi:Domain of unknown function (DUF397)